MYPPPPAASQSHYRLHTGLAPAPAPTTPLVGTYAHPHSAPPFGNITVPFAAQSHSPTPAFSGRPSSLLFPVTLGNVTSSVINSASPPVQGNPRKRKNAISSSSANPPKKRIVPHASSNASTPPVPITSTETVCGVGPTAASSVPSTIPGPTVTATPSTQLNGYQYAEKLTRRSTDKKSATDIWFFLEPLTADAVNPGPTWNAEVPDILTMKPLLTKKPDEREYPRLRCRLCSKWKTWANCSGVTGTVRTHLKEDLHHCPIYNIITKQLNLKHADDPNPVNKASAEPFTVEEWLNRLVRWVVVDDQSVNVVDNPEFRNFVLYGRDDVSDPDLPHRTMLTQLIAAAYTKQHKDLKDGFKEAIGRHSQTADIWSDGNLTAFMAISDHYMTRDTNGHLVMKSCLLAFRVIEGTHDGKHLADIIYDIFEEAGLLHVLGQFTLDNAGNNNTTLRRLVELLKRDGIDYSEDGNRV